MSSADLSIGTFEAVASDGHTLSLRGHRHPEHKLPTILLLHGRSFSSAPVWECPGLSTMEALAELGVAAYSVDMRGFGRTPTSKESEPAPRNRLLRPSLAASDVADAVEWVRERIGVDVPLGLMGWSYGALVVALAAAGQRRPSTPLAD